MQSTSDFPLEFEQETALKKDFSQAPARGVGWRFDFHFVSCFAHLNFHDH